MIPFFIYALKVISISGLLFGYYYLFLRNGRFHEWNRYYLVLSAVISLALPFAKWSVLFPGYSGSNRIYVAELQSFTIISSGHLSSSSGWSWTTWTLVLYVLISSILIAALIVGILNIRSRIRHGEKQKFPIFTLVRHPKVENPFSFFRFIFWNDLLALDTPEGSHIFKHELAHVREKHSADKLLMEIIISLFWINPFFHLIRKELHIIHEFIADRRACQNNAGTESPGYLSPQDYATLLVKQCMRTNNIAVANHFFQKQLTRRVRMLVRNNKQRFTYIKRVMAIPLTLVVALFFIFLQSQAKTNSSFTVNTANAKNKKFIASAGNNLPPEKVVVLSKLSPKQETVSSKKVKISQPAPPALKNLTHRVFNNSDDSKIADAGIAPGSVFKFVEQMPEFPGGDEALMTYLRNHIHYPAIARKDGIQGTVVVQFLVNRDGHLSKVTTVGRQLGGGLEEEATRVVKRMPDWIAGKQNGRKVTVQYSLPVRFVLQDEVGKSTANNSLNVSPPPPPSPPKPVYNTKNSTHKVFMFVQQMPSFSGGQEALVNYLHNHIHYPTVARENGIQGTVVVQFIVNPDGHLSNISTVGKTLGGGLEEEAARVVNGMPDWIPGKQNGNDVAVQYALPVRFMLQ